VDTVYLIIFLVVLVFVLPWIFLARSNRNRKRENQRVQSQVQDLTARVYANERAVKELLARQRETSTTTVAAIEAAAPVAPSPTTPKSTTPSATPSTSPPIAPPRPIHPEIPPPSPSQPVAAPPPPHAPTETHTPPPAHAPVPFFTSPHSTRATTSWAAQLKTSLDLEEMLGTNWLNKLGIVILVLGVAFFLAYQMRTLGPAGKVLVGFVTGAVLLGAGVWAERHHRYRILARAGIGGGWALIFFTTYAMYHVPAAHVITSQATDLILMLAVAAVMVVHTLRYDSQAVTGIAFLLAFLTVTVNHSNVYSLAAGVVLAVALVVIVRRKQWFELELMGIAASYLNHYLWLRPIIEPMHAKHHPFPE
jgi:uncharacterized membrane protein